jgi:hypothetical protein
VADSKRVQPTILKKQINTGKKKPCDLIILN